MTIHSTAIIGKNVKIGVNCKIGPYCVIKDDVEIGDNTIIEPYVHVGRYTTIGKNCRIYMGANIGDEPQDHSFKPGVISFTEIGDNTVIREYVTIHRPPVEGLKTIIGSHVLLMAFVHVAHDVVIGDKVTIANHTALTGHVQVEPMAVISGYCMIHQFCRIGSLAMVTAGARIRQDVPPYCLLGENDYIYGPNIIGMRRAGFSQELRMDIRKAIKTYFFQDLNKSVALELILSGEHSPEVNHFVDFIKSSKRGIMPGRAKYVEEVEI
ncbi:MAG TPA: acyl-ACP--UDP-N-acetylglucosamine O-acyltransferase [Victivallales bacterium]|nr:acyl-ACP--UDP-N-acetylglucosamine O-acyltransferase [Victivallales bacterium]HRR05658.1 acyl-ACP--UDP-N-acetylglucosamine O-acyltransferase [Victivallales bacterium]HRU00187.1 acyl-ACP--UDP-N-acetylglucosamine O-acyltransferase [Victivallales bacterium]